MTVLEKMSSSQEGVDWMPDYYAILGVERFAAPEMVHAAFRKRMQEGYHPDV